MQNYQNSISVAIGLADPDKQNNFIRATIPIFALAPHEQSTPNMTVRIEGSNNLTIGGKSFSSSAQNSPSFTAPISGTETHLLYAYNDNGTLTLAIKTSGFSAGDPSTYNVEYPICEVELSDDDTSITNDMITDVRVFNYSDNQVQRILENQVFN